MIKYNDRRSNIQVVHIIEDEIIELIKEEAVNGKCSPEKLCHKENIYIFKIVRWLKNTLNTIIVK